MIKVLTSIFIASIIILGCAGVSDIVEKIPNGYVYTDEASQQKWIMKNPLSVDTDLYIPCKILKYKYNRNYIIAKIQFHYDMNCVVGFKESKNLKEGEIYYYIIDTKNNIRYGAFKNKKYYLKMKKKLNIQIKL
jgi:hypothetical protein